MRACRQDTELYVCLSIVFAHVSDHLQSYNLISMVSTGTYILLTVELFGVSGRDELLVNTVASEIP